MSAIANPPSAPVAVLPSNLSKNVSLVGAVVVSVAPDGVVPRPPEKADAVYWSPKEISRFVYRLMYL